MSRKPSPSKQHGSEHPESIEAIGKRLRLVRLAFSKLQRRDRPMSQAEFARLCGVGSQAHNNAETGDNRLGIDGAKAVVRRTGVGLDFLYFGTRDHLPLNLAVAIEEVEREDAKAAKSVA